MIPCAAAEMVALLEGSTLSTEERYQVLGHLSEYGPSACLDGRPAVGRILTFPLCYLGTSKHQNKKKNVLFPLLYALTCTVNSVNCRTLQTGAYLSQLCLIKLIYHRWTPIKMKKHLMADQWKQDAPEVSLELHGKGCEYVCACDFLVFYF